MKKLLISVSILLVLLLAVNAVIHSFALKREQREIDKSFSHLMQSPLSTSLTPVTEPETEELYYSAKYRAQQHEGFEVFEIGNIRLVRRGYSESTSGGASGSVVLPGRVTISGFETMYADSIEVFGKVFDIEGDELLLGDTRLKITSPEPQSLEVDANWIPKSDA